MGQEYSVTYVGVGYSISEAMKNLEMVLRGTRDDTLRTGPDKYVYRRGQPEKRVLATVEVNLVNGIRIASVTL